MFQFCYDYEEHFLNRGMHFDIRDWTDRADNKDDLIEKIKELYWGSQKKR